MRILILLVERIHSVLLCVLIFWYTFKLFVYLPRNGTHVVIIPLIHSKRSQVGKSIWFCCCSCTAHLPTPSKLWLSLLNLISQKPSIHLFAKHTHKAFLSETICSACCQCAKAGLSVFNPSPLFSHSGQNASASLSLIYLQTLPKAHLLCSTVATSTLLQNAVKTSPVAAAVAK